MPVVSGSVDDVGAAQGVAQLFGRLGALADPRAEELGHEHAGEASLLIERASKNCSTAGRCLRKRFGKLGGTSSRVGVATGAKPVWRRRRSFQIAWIEATTAGSRTAPPQ